MEEKKLIAEEIVKALECCKQGNTRHIDCPRLKNIWLIEEGGNGMHVHDCQNELRQQAIELIQEQKAEIERLTEENGWLSKECNKTTDECSELQKQVDGLKIDLENWKKAAYGYKYAEEQAVKNAKKEIFAKVKAALNYLDDEWEISNALYQLEKECNGEEMK